MAWGSHGAYMLRREARVKARARRSWRQDWEYTALCCVPQLGGGGVTLGTSVGRRAGKASEAASQPRSSMLLPSGKASVTLHLLIQGTCGWMQKAEFCVVKAWFCSACTQRRMLRKKLLPLFRQSVLSYIWQIEWLQVRKCRAGWQLDLIWFHLLYRLSV